MTIRREFFCSTGGTNTAVGTDNSSAAVSIFDILFDFLYAVHGAPKLFAWPVDRAPPVGT